MPIVMAALPLAALLLAMVVGSDAAWCVCNSGMSDAALQKTLDFACGAGADCGPIQQNGACYNPNSVRAHCSYAANSYYQRKGQGQDACVFQNTATLTSTDPSYSGCTYPATTSAAGTSTTTGTGSQGTTSSFTPTGGLGPSDSFNDSSDSNLLAIVRMLSLLPAIFLALAFLI